MKKVRYIVLPPPADSTDAALFWPCVGVSFYRLDKAKERLAFLQREAPKLYGKSVIFKVTISMEAQNA
jgi:hypothetical protein